MDFPSQATAAPTPLSQAQRPAQFIVLGIGLILIIGFIAIAGLSKHFPQGPKPTDGAIISYIVLALCLGLCLPLLLRYAPKLSTIKHSSSKAIIGFIFAIGLAARAIMFSSEPIMEDDWNRYLWDGAVAAKGIDPYAYSPAQAAPYDRLGQEIARSDDPALAQMQDMAIEHSVLHERINFPSVKTIYPPLAQSAFVAAHKISPYELTGWRAVLLIMDLIAFGLCLYALKAYGRPLALSALYWWNPVVILEGFNSAHMDILIVPFLFGLIALLGMKRRGWASIALAFAAGVKIWPALLMPALARPWLSRPMKFVIMGAIFTALTALLLLPQLLHVGDESQGLSLYSSSWRRHAFLFAVLNDGVFFSAADPGKLARICVALFVITAALWMAWRAEHTPQGTVTAMLWAIVALILLSPTGYPWYLIWAAPFLCFVPRYGLAALMMLAPLYYMRFLLGDEALIYQWGVVPIAFGLPLVIMLIEGQRRRHGAA